MRTVGELESEARSNHDAAARALRMARGLTVSTEIERLERFAAELESRATELDRQAALAAQGQVSSEPLADQPRPADLLEHH